MAATKMMYRVVDPENPPSEIEECPYDELLFERDPLWRETKLAAIRAGKAHFVNKVLYPAKKTFSEWERRFKR